MRHEIVTTDIASVTHPAGRAQVGIDTVIITACGYEASPMENAVHEATQDMDISELVTLALRGML